MAINQDRTLLRSFGFRFPMCPLCGEMSYLMNASLACVISAVFFLLTIELSAQQFRPFDAEQFFMRGDADLDGRLSLTEYRDLMRNSLRMRNAQADLERMFRRMDFNRDGFLSLSEYSWSFSRRPSRIPARPAAERPIPDAVSTSQDAISDEQQQFFETAVLPVFSRYCVECHSSDSSDSSDSGNAENSQGGLRLDSREGMRRGGNSGPAIVPGHPEASLLIRAIHYRDDSFQMPPDEKLPDATIADLEAWVRMGAPDPRTDSVSMGGHAAGPLGAGNLPQAREFWSFRPPQESTLPEVSQADWPRGEIDQYVLAALDAQALVPVSDASPQRLLRRVTFDLIGLPPTPDELDAFLADDSPGALERLVDRLLASPRFGERWGRHWLDVARYAESSGKTNFSYPQAWRYRDWTIDSFNTDKPYDQFVREQIAGDLLPAEDDRQRAEQLIATGFLALGSKAHDAENRGQFILDLIDEQIEATTRAFLGLTVSCARCHDHKLDPITQRDYYALSGIFRSTWTCSGTLAGVFPNFNASPLIELPDGANVASVTSELTPRQRIGMEQRLERLEADRAAIPPGEQNRDRQRRADSMIATLRYRLLMDRPGQTPRTFAMGVRERDRPLNSPLFIRGELEQPGVEVPRGLIRVFINDNPESMKTHGAITSGSGRRELADWLASPENPLTARVMVNRVWLHLFGRGLVATPDNFGAAGTRPSHPELLDRLTIDFVNDGWSIKRLIRRIVLSRVYGLDSTHDTANFEADPDNTLIWRMSKRRLDAEVIRDTLLFVGGNLETTPPIGSGVARSGEGLAFFVRTDGLEVSNSHRSVYLPVVRDQILETLALFDFADPSLVTGSRATTTGPAQALYFMNGPLVIREAESLADHLLSIEDDEARRIASAYRIVISREPTGLEQQRAAEFMRAFAASGKDRGLPRRAWSIFCQALLASAEFRYLD